MTAQRETPASQRRQALGTTGVRIAGPSVAPVPAWARRKGPASLLWWEGQYHTPETLREAVGAAAEAERGCRGPAPYADPQTITPEPVGQLPGAGSEKSYPPPADPLLVERFREQWGEPGAPLPCRSLETTQPNDAQNPIPAGLVGPRKKVALALSWNVANLCRTHGVERVGFLTLTFADHVTDAREAQRRFNSLATHVLRKRYPAHVAVLERQKTGRIHYHLLVVLPDDIRTGIDFDSIAQGDYRTANKPLRLEWAFWRKTAPLYRFGRTELLPIKSDADALGQYVGKYIAKGQAFRTEADKGVRLVRYSGGARMATCKFAELSKYPSEWRAKVCTFTRQMAAAYPHRRIRDMDDLAFHFGTRWAYHWRDYILALPPADLTVPF